MSDEKTRMLKKAQALLDQRFTVIENLLDARAEEKRHEQALQASRRVTAEAWARATALGWSEGELRQLSIRKPTVRAPGRPRRSKTPPTPPTVPKDGAESSTTPAREPRPAGAPGPAPSAPAGVLTGT